MIFIYMFVFLKLLIELLKNVKSHINPQELCNNKLIAYV